MRALIRTIAAAAAAVTVLLLAASGETAAGSRHVYWANSQAGTIGRANLDGTGLNLHFITGADNPFAVAVDSGHVYWTNQCFSTCPGPPPPGSGTIGRASLDGTGVDQSFITGATIPRGLAVDAG